MIGRTVGAPGGEVRVIGVLPPDVRIGGSELGPMTAGRATQFFIPFAFGPQSGGDLRSVWSNFNYTVIGRLKPGVTPSQALSQLEVIQANLAANAPDPAEGMTLHAEVTPVLDYATESSRQGLWLLLGAVAAVLLVISVNLGGLWVNRVVDRRRDWGIRMALGARPGRLARQVLVEGVTLGLAGGVVGVACAAAGLRGLLALAPQDIPRLDEVHVDWRVLLVGLLISAVAGLLTGLIPALRVGRGAPGEQLRVSGRSATAGPSNVRSRQSLIGLQAALSTLLVAVAGFLGFSLYHLMTRPTGFTTENAVEARVVITSYGDAERERILGQVTDAVGAIPGVESVGLTSHLPLQGETWIDGAGVPGVQYADAQQPRVNIRFIGGSYFSAMGIPLIAGRDFRETDRPAAWPPESRAEEEKMHETVIISAATAKLIWPGKNPRTLIGEQIMVNGLTPTIVGVAADALDGTLTSEAPAVVYQPYWKWDSGAFSLVLRTTLPLRAIAAPLRAEIWKLAPNAPIPEIEPLQTLRATATAPQRYQLTLLLAFAALALLLAAIGVYALVSHSVAQRRKELADPTRAGLVGGLHPRPDHRAGPRAGRPRSARGRGRGASRRKAASEPVLRRQRARPRPPRRGGWRRTRGRAARLRVARSPGDARRSECGTADGIASAHRSASISRRARPDPDFSASGLTFPQSGRRDLNPRPPEPHSGALPGCATSRGAGR